eukprot:g820.t1
MFDLKESDPIHNFTRSNARFKRSSSSPLPSTTSNHIESPSKDSRPLKRSVSFPYEQAEHEEIDLQMLDQTIPERRQYQSHMQYPANKHDQTVRSETKADTNVPYFQGLYVEAFTNVKSLSRSLSRFMSETFSGFESTKTIVEYEYPSQYFENTRGDVPDTSMEWEGHTSKRKIGREISFPHDHAEAEESYTNSLNMVSSLSGGPVLASPYGKSAWEEFKHR